MPSDTGARSVLQVARKRRLSVYPDEFGMEQDICDVTLWLIEKHCLPRVHVWVDRHYTHVGRQIAGVTVMTPPRHPARLTEAAHEAFLALAYTIEHTGADTYGHEFATGITRGTRPSRPTRASRKRYAVGDQNKRTIGSSERGGESRPFYCSPMMDLPAAKVLSIVHTAEKLIRGKKSFRSKGRPPAAPFLLSRKRSVGLPGLDQVACLFRWQR